MFFLGGQRVIDIGLQDISTACKEHRARNARCTSLPVLTQPFTSWISPRPIILKRISRVRGSSTSSDVARSDLSFMFAYELGPFLFTPTPMSYGWLICAICDEYLESVASWPTVLSLVCVGAVGAAEAEAV